jgi:hypothetical protein
LESNAGYVNAFQSQVNLEEDLAKSGLLLINLHQASPYQLHQSLFYVSQVLYKNVEPEA